MLILLWNSRGSHRPQVENRSDFRGESRSSYISSNHWFQWSNDLRRWSYIDCKYTFVSPFAPLHEFMWSNWLDRALKCGCKIREVVKIHGFGFGKRLELSAGIHAYRWDVGRGIYRWYTWLEGKDALDTTLNWKKSKLLRKVEPWIHIHSREGKRINWIKGEKHL